MRTTLYFLFLLVLVVSCEKDSLLPTQENEENAPIINSDVSSYDPNEIPQQQNPQENLLANGGFENNDSAWVLCGASTILSSSVAKEGERFLELSSQGSCELDNRSFGELHGNAYHPLNIESTPQEIHVSFYIKSSEPLTLLSDPVNVLLLGNTDLYEWSGALSVPFLNIHGDVIGTEWTQINLSLKKSDIETYLGNVTPKWLYIDIASTYSDLENITIAIDDVKVTYTKEVTVPEPMPQNLLNYSGDDRILFVNLDKNVVATMKPNGSNLIDYDNISTEIISSVPFWYDDQTILLGRKVFKPLPNTDASVIASSETQLYKINLDNGDETLLFETLGNPGRYEFEGSVNNLNALDVEVKRVDWDAARKRGALTVCAQNRSFGFVSDDYCLIYIIDEEGNLLNSETEGFNAVWSSSGKMAYVLHGTIYLADVTGSTVNSNVLYQSNSDLNDVVNWSPNGNKLVFMERGGDTVNTGNGSVYASSIKTLDISTGEIKELVLVNHGTAYPNVSWSQDGNYIIYSLFIPNKDNPNLGNNQIWWVEISSGKTGPITNTINAYSGNFK